MQCPRGRIRVSVRPAVVGKKLFCSVLHQVTRWSIPTCRRTHPHQRWAQWGWCHSQLSGAWRTDELQLFVYKNKSRGDGTYADGPGVGDMFPQLHMLPPVRQEVCGVRWSQAHSAGRACPIAEPGWWCWRRSWSSQTGSWHRFLKHPGAVGWSRGPCFFNFYLTFIYTGNLIETQGLILKRDLVRTTAVIRHKVTGRQDIQYRDKNRTQIIKVISAQVPKS